MIVKTDKGTYIAPDDAFFTIRIVRDNPVDARERMNGVIEFYKSGGQLPDGIPFSDLVFISEETHELAVPPQFTIVRRYVRDGKFTFTQSSK